MTDEPSPMYGQVIRVIGCDDTTEVTMQLTQAEAIFLDALIKAVNAASQYNCQPKMESFPVDSDGYPVLGVAP